MAMPRRRPEERSEAAVTMAGDAKHVGARKMDPRNRETRKQWHREKEGSKGVLTAGENEDGDGSGTMDRAGGRTADHGAAVVASSCTGERERGAGETA